MSNSKNQIYEVTMYTTKNFRTKKELKVAVDMYNVQAPLYEDKAIPVRYCKGTLSRTRQALAKIQRLNGSYRKKAAMSKRTSFRAMLPLEGWSMAK